MIDATFFDEFCPRSLPLRLRRAKSVTELRDGTVIPSQVGAPLFAGEAQLRQMSHGRALAAEARLGRLMQPGHFVLAYDARLNGPALDTGGVALGAAIPTIHTLNADNLRLRIGGLPPGYVLSPGDWIGWQYLANPVRYALHQIVTSSVASASGLTPLFEVAPHIRPGVTIGAAVSLVRPRGKFVVTGVQSQAQRGPAMPGAQITLIQSLR